jgi:parallel beta-helix repeat protein
MRGTIALLLAGLATILGGPALSQDATASIAETGQAFSSLQQALDTAAAGQTVSLEGRHAGTFLIDKTLTLSGVGEAILDGGGGGTVLVIAADDVRVEGLTVQGSGISATPLTVWGDAGIRIDADGARLSGLTVRDNDWGILLRGGAGSEIVDSEITDNRMDGIKLMGGEGHVIARNRLLRNKTGVLVDALYEGGALRETIVPEMNDPKSLARCAEVKDTAVPATGHVIEDNHVEGNEAMGITLFWYARDNRVIGNDVFLTGITRPVGDEATTFWEAALSAMIGATVDLDAARFLGTGILLSCMPEQNLVRDNHSRDNLAYGIGLSETYRNRLETNRVDGNRIGLNMERALENVVTGNRISDNAEYGILIDLLMTRIPAGRPSSGNRFTANSISGSAVNAYDSSDTKLTFEDFDRIVEDMPWPAGVREQVLGDPAMRRQVVRQMSEAHAPGMNHWHVGTVGNHYGDFDTADEGFVDEDADGIGEAGHPIPGGGHVDRFPLTAERAAQEASR